VLTKLGFIGPEDLLKTLGAQLGLGWVNLALAEIPTEVLALLKYDSVRARRMLPISKEGRELVLGMVDPTDFKAIEEAQFQSGCTVRPVIVSTAQFEQVLDLFVVQGYAAGPVRLGLEQALESLDDGLRDRQPESDAAALAEALEAAEDALAVRGGDAEAAVPDFDARQLAGADDDLDRRPARRVPRAGRCCRRPTPGSPGGRATGPPARTAPCARRRRRAAGCAPGSGPGPPRRASGASSAPGPGRDPRARPRRAGCGAGRRSRCRRIRAASGCRR
jgi:hypothetical protein